jgi:hypothetical protein
MLPGETFSDYEWAASVDFREFDPNALELVIEGSI